MAYCETLSEFKLVTNIQVSSLRIAIEVGNEFVVVIAGLNGLRLPVVVLTR